MIRSKTEKAKAAAIDDAIFRIVSEHGPITLAQVAHRRGLRADRSGPAGVRAINNALARLKRAGRVEHDRTVGWMERRLCPTCGGTGRAR